MGLTQKYKQQQQQVRVQTNESNYIKGMQFVDHPLSEGYSRVLINFDIDSLAGKLIPRKGLKSLGSAPADFSAEYGSIPYAYSDFLPFIDTCPSSVRVTIAQIGSS